jgi:hypothetical protein
VRRRCTAAAATFACPSLDHCVRYRSSTSARSRFEFTASQRRGGHNERMAGRHDRVELAAEWLMLRADRGRLKSTRIKGLV